MPLYITLSMYDEEVSRNTGNLELLPTIYIAFLFSVTLKMKKMYLNI